MICGYSFKDGAVCMQEEGHGPIAGAAHLHPDDLIVKMWPGHCSHEGSYFELANMLHQIHVKFQTRWLQEDWQPEYEWDLRLDNIEAVIDEAVTFYGDNSKAKAKIGVETHGKCMKLYKMQPNPLDERQVKRLKQLMTRIMEDLFDMQPTTKDNIWRTTAT